MPHKPDLVNQRFGRLTVLSRNDEITGIRWDCLCDCGGTACVTTRNLKKDRTKSCGCLQKEVVGSLRRTHGLTHSPEYTVWQLMKDRCSNPKNKDFHSYGGRGISVCDRWVNSFENFLCDMGQKPSCQHSIDRINNNGNYEPNNCRWATPVQQAKNQRTNVIVFHGNQIMSLGEFADLIGTTRAALHQRRHRRKLGNPVISSDLL